MNHLHHTPEQDVILQDRRDIAYSRDLARISSTLLAALIALLTFLLIVGVQTRVTGFTTELYTAIILLGVSLVLFAASHFARGLDSPGVGTGIRILQQLVFVASIIAVIWFVISYAQLVLKPPTAPQGVPQGQGQAQPQDPSSAQQGQPQDPSAPSAQQGARPQPGQ